MILYQICCVQYIYLQIEHFCIELLPKEIKRHNRMFRMMSCTIKIQINMFKTDVMNGYIQAYAGLYTIF